MIIHKKIKIYLAIVYVVGLCLGLSVRVVGQAVNIAPQATIDDAGLNYVSYAGWQSNQSFITDGNIGTYQQEDYQVAFDNASTKLLTFYLDQEYTNITVKFFNSSIHNTSGINGTTFYLFNTDTFAVSPPQTLNESNEDAAHVIEWALITDDFTSGYNTVVFQFLNDNISFREIEIYGTPINPTTGDPTPTPVGDYWKAEPTGVGIYHDEGMVRIGSTATLPYFNPNVNSYESPTGLLVNGHTTFNVGRGEVYLENNPLDDASGAGLTLRTSQDPGWNGAIFTVRSSGHAARLFVGQGKANFGKNEFYFGGDDVSTEANITNEYKGILTKKGWMGIGELDPKRMLHIRGGADGEMRIDRNQFGASLLFANYSQDWSTIENSGLMIMKANGDFEIVDFMGTVEGNNQELLLRIKEGSHDVHLPNSLSVGIDADVLEGTVAHFDGRVYISEEDSMVDAAAGESTTERGFTDQAHDNYKEYLLWIEKGIVTTDFAITDIENWPDYVFDEEYKLLSINELKSYIKQYGHLPTMPSAKEVASNGFTLGDMTKRTLQTIEEMTLYVVDHDENLDSLQVEADIRIEYLRTLIEKRK